MTALEIFRLIASEYASVEDQVVTQWIELVRPLVSKRKFGSLYEQALAYLAAHRMKLCGDSSYSSNEGALGFSVANAMQVSSYSEGSTSISFANGAATTGTDSDLTLTAYGVEFLSLRRRVIIPIVSSGEAR